MYCQDVKLKAVQVLNELLIGQTSADRALLERRFAERARGFTQTLEFVKELKALRADARHVYPNHRLRTIGRALKAGKQDFVRHLIGLVISSNTGYGAETRQVCHAFQLDAGHVRLSSERLGRKYYAARNLLLEAGAMQLHHQTGTYTIQNWFHNYFIKAVYGYGPTPQEVQDRMRDRTDLGLLAELEVLKAERKTVGDKDASKVIHIALENSSAGFDIASVRRNRDTEQCKVRLIEVKAVSPRDWQFIFTRNEVRMATQTKSAYFLYLIPVTEGRPNVHHAYIVEDPVEHLQNLEEWQISQGDWIVSKRLPHG